MELFYGHIEGDCCHLDSEEAGHCVKVLRHKVGDTINAMDGNGNMLECKILSCSPKEVEAQIVSRHENWGSHPYVLNLAVCPTKNNERFEMFVEKAVEFGVDNISPVIGEHSERKIYKTQRAERIALSAAKQSLKATIPQISEAVSVKEYCSAPTEGLKLIAYCFEDGKRRSIDEVLKEYSSACEGTPQITVLIGPEGDFSPSEAEVAMAAGYIPVVLGESRLRTETAAIYAAAATYFIFGN